MKFIAANVDTIVSASIARAAVRRDYPEAAKVVKVVGGFMMFETMTEYQTWQRQK